MPDLDSAPGALAVGWDLGPFGLVMSLISRGVGAADLVEQAVEAGFIGIVEVGAVPVEILERRVVEHLALAGRGEDDEFMAEVAADRARRGLHRHRADAEPLEGPQIGQQLRVIGVARAGFVEIERVGILHQEFAAAHHAVAGADFVAEFPLDVIEGARQIAVAFDVVAE